LALFLIFFSLSLILPLTVSAFWWFGSNKTNTVSAPVVPEQKFSEQDKLNLNNKYKIWTESFEKKNIESLIANQNKFIFSLSELNYLSATESKKVKNPTLTELNIASQGSDFSVKAQFHKFINGHFSFIASVVSVENKINVKLTNVRLYGVPVPAKLLEKPVNKELDKYFAFMYADSRYQGFSFINKDESIQLKPEFKK
jgi:hypothetical protein